MEASIAATVKKSSSDGEWTVVLPSRRRHGRRKPKPKVQEEEEEEEEQKPWKSDDLEIDPQRQARLKQKMEISVKKIESSKFYTSFLEQLKSQEVSDQFRLVLASETHLQVVMYGIGSIESYESPRLQLSIAILMKREFDWVGNIEVFDPILSATESSVLESLGCTVLSVNEQARREALKPTLFFMPHCEANLYSNLLQANWRTDRLSRIALFGNSFQMYEEQVTLDPEVIRATKRIVAARRITSEFAIETVSDDYFAAFHDSSWHFFSPGGVDSELPLLVSEGF
uniref:Protein SENSITIVITY TO RED LIGHT REDUCED 1 n=1 Tax=Noccaea caerulescens TaxID=107243 RepID=A0A1J3HM31_NOCCA